jgi:hypothetical protein
MTALKLFVVPVLAVVVSVSPLHAQDAQQGGSAGDPDASVTFTKDVLPILYRSCVQCHQPGTAAPMSLMTYEDAHRWTGRIAERVQSREMPPWHLDRSVGEYDPDPSLSDEEIATIVEWVDRGAPRGEPGDAPPPPELTPFDAWTFGEPDLILTADEVVIPPGVDEFWQRSTLETGLTEDRYIKWIQTIPSEPRVVHHVITRVNDDPGLENLLREARVECGTTMVVDCGSTTDLDVYAVGSRGDIFPPGTGRLLRAGALIRFNGHYNSLDEEVRETTRVGIGFYPRGEEPEHRAVTLALRTGVPSEEGRLNQLSIPPHADNVRHDMYFHLEQPVKVINVMPHMHFLGKRLQLEAIFRDGHRKLLTDITHYDFRWQITYTYKDPPVLPAGTFLHLITYHDNSANNRYNPDPSSWIGTGERTIDEMGNGYVTVVHISDGEFEAFVDEQEQQGKAHIHR